MEGDRPNVFPPVEFTPRVATDPGEPLRLPLLRRSIKAMETEGARSAWSCWRIPPEGWVFKKANNSQGRGVREEERKVSMSLQTHVLSDCNGQERKERRIRHEEKLKEQIDIKHIINGICFLSVCGCERVGGCQSSARHSWQTPLNAFHSAASPQWDRLLLKLIMKACLASIHSSLSFWLFSLPRGRRSPSLKWQQLTPCIWKCGFLSSIAQFVCVCVCVCV